MKKFLIPLIVTPMVYFAIAVTLVWVPVKRNQSNGGLDFDVLSLVDNVEAETINDYYTARDGNQLFFRQIVGDADIVVVLLHGSGSEGRYLIPLATKLNHSLGVNAIIPDLRGHGKSALARMGDIDYVGQYEDDLDDLRKVLRLKYADAQIVLGGHSSGGGLAAKYGGSSRKQFDGYLLLAPYLGYQAPTVRPSSGGWVQVSQRRYAGLAMLNNFGITLFNELPVLFFNRPQSLTDRWQADSYSYRLNESLAPKSYANALKANQRPMLVLVGSDDEALYADKFASVFNEYAPDAELYVISGSKHLDLPLNQIAITKTTQWLSKSYGSELQRGNK